MGMGSGRRLDALNDEQGGAVLLLCLAAILMLLLMSWAVLDGIFVSHDKSEAQASADMAAYSQASVKARSMNMMAFTNVGKRSLVGVHATYRGMFRAFAEWLFNHHFLEQCDPEEHTIANCPDATYQENLQLFLDEDAGDYLNFNDNTAYYIADLRAIDTYQEYLVAMTPWWGWTEAVMRAQRNGATLATSFPPPPRGEDFPFGSERERVRAEVPGASSFTVPSSKVDGLPVQRSDFWAMTEEGMEREEWRDWERQRNIEIHGQRSEHGAASTEVLDIGDTAEIDEYLDLIADAGDSSPGADTGWAGLAHYGRPWTLNRNNPSQANWLFDTSNIIMTYHHQPEYFRTTREKYEPFGNDYLPDDESTIAVETYQPRGYWGLARSEISYQVEEEPNLWRAAWTARMRPVALPNEFRDAGERFNMIYYAVLDYLLLSAHLHEDTAGDTADFFNDLVYFEKVSRAMGQSTIEGVGK